jgi:hypothetical protein
MKFYYFGGNMDMIDDLVSHGFAGTLFLYNASSGDHFTEISRKINPDIDFKYMVAIRPYAMSPQYLCMINNTINTFAPDRLQINLISGYTKTAEFPYNGFVGRVNDNSSDIEKSTYLIDYLSVINEMKIKVPDFYVSTTNEHVLQAASKHNNKIIMPYSYYIKNINNVKNQKVIVSIGPILRETEEEFEELKAMGKPDDTSFYTIKHFSKILLHLKYHKIEEVLIYSWPNEEINNIMKFVKRFKEDPALYEQAIDPSENVLY